MSDGQPEATPTILSDGPRLSMIVPCYNSAATIERALASILDEGGVPFECIVVDDGSTDGTPDLVQTVTDRDPRVVLIRLPKNAGVSNARNTGLAATRGEWVAFHDADDRMCPGWLRALTGPTDDPDVLAVVGQRIWSDGERTWLSPLYDIPDIRQPGRKSIARNPGLMYYAAATGKVFHRSLLEGLQFEGRVGGDQAWTIRALLRADGRIEVVGDTVFEWSRPHPDRFVATITTAARASASATVGIAEMAPKAFAAVSSEVDAQISDEATRMAVKGAYFDRLIRSDLSAPVNAALDRRDPDIGQLYDAIAAFVQSVPPAIIATSDLLITLILRPPAKRWSSLVRQARPSYWRMVRRAMRADPGMARRIAKYRVFQPVFVLGGSDAPIRQAAASATLSTVSITRRVLGRDKRQ